MVKTQERRRVRASPPWKYSWIEDWDDLEKLAEIYSKLQAITDVFSGYSRPSEQPAMAAKVYGFWFIFRDICDELADVLKLEKWHEEADQQSV